MDKNMNNPKEIEDLNDSFINAQSKEYKEMVLRNIEKLKRAFKTIDKDSDNLIDSKELLDFLDSNMPTGKIYDRNTFKTIFSQLDKNKDGTVSIGEFIKQYVKVEEDLKIQLHEYQVNLEREQSNLERFRKLMNDTRNEILNEEGIARDATITSEVVNVYSPDKTPPTYPLSVNVKFNNESSSTGVKKEIFGLINRKFKFPVKSRRSSMLFEVYNHQVPTSPLLLGESTIPLETLESQDEYDLELEIQEDEENPESLLLKVKIQFIWSYYKYYQDLYNTTEQTCNELGNAIQKGNLLLEEPFKYITQIDNSRMVESHIFVMNNATSKPPKTENQTPAAIIDKQTQYKYADKVEDFIKTKFNRPNIKWLPVIKLLIYSNLILTFMTLFSRADFINVIIPLFMVMIFYTSYNNRTEYYLNIFLKLLGVSLSIDVLWLIFHAGTYASGTKYDAGMENSLKGFVLIVSFIALFFRMFLTIAMWIEKLKTERRGNQLLNGINRQI